MMSDTPRPVDERSNSERRQVSFTPQRRGVHRGSGSGKRRFNDRVERPMDSPRREVADKSAGDGKRG